MMLDKWPLNARVQLLPPARTTACTLDRHKNNYNENRNGR